MSSNAVGLDLVSRIVGYKITKGNFQTTSPNLPQSIAILAEANTANQSSLDTSPTVITSAQQAGELYGYGSPVHIIMRILRPYASEGVGSIPTIVYAQEEASGATAKVLTITPTGTVTENGTHTIKICGRYGLDATSYDVNIEVGDSVATITGKIASVVNNVLGTPVIATSDSTKATLTAKWKGLTSNDINVTVDTNGKDLGLSYAVASTTSGAGTPDIADALAAFGNQWNTWIINSYGTVSSIMSDLEAFNGIPDPEVPTGRYAGIIMKPFIALTGSVAEDPSSVTDSRKDDVTIAICPAPLSTGLPMEAAANMAVLAAKVAQNSPHLDVSGKSYPDMPTPDSIGDMAEYTNRDLIVKKGCSTVDLVNGRYVVQDFVTTYHPVGENPPQFKYCRNLMIDFNVRFGYYNLEQIHVVDHTISNDTDIVSASNVIKPKQWKQVLDNYALDLTKRALIVDAPFMQNSITVELSSTNPDRLETFFRYKRSGYARISSTTAEAGFNFGNV